MCGAAKNNSVPRGLPVKNEGRECTAQKGFPRELPIMNGGRSSPPKLPPKNAGRDTSACTQCCTESFPKTFATKERRTRHLRLHTRKVVPRRLPPKNEGRDTSAHTHVYLTFPQFLRMFLTARAEKHECTHRSRCLEKGFLARREVHLPGRQLTSCRLHTVLHRKISQDVCHQRTKDETPPPTQCLSDFPPVFAHVFDGTRRET